MSGFQTIKQIGKAYRRHIVVDNIAKVVYIEVLWSITGELRQQEYYDILNGVWWKYVPKTEIEQFRRVINGGYRLQAVWNSGAQNEEFYIIQLAGFEQEKPIIT